MADHPKRRRAIEEPSFTNTGVDIFRPFLLKLSVVKLKDIV